MAANLSGMFAQLNNAIQQRPTGEGLLNQVSQGLGGLMGGMTGADPYSFMNPGAKVLQGTQDMGGLDLTTARGMSEPAQLYQKMGQPEKAVQLAMQARQMQEADTAKLDQGQEDIRAMGAETRLHRAALQQARNNGDTDAVELISSGVIKPSDYLKQTMASNAKVREALSTRKPNRQITEVAGPDGAPVKVVYDLDAGAPVAIVGSAKENMNITDMINPETGQPEKALVSDSGKVRFVGESKPDKPSYSYPKTPSGKIQVFKDGVPQGIFDTQTEAEKQMAKYNEMAQVANLQAVVDQSRQMIQDKAGEWNGVGGWKGLLRYLPQTEARTFESLINTVKSNVGFDALQRMREAGGTLGQVAIIELIMLQSETGNLDTLSDPAALDATLQRIESSYNRISQALASGEPDALFTDVPGGGKMYRIDENRIAYFAPDGSLEIKVKGQP